MKLAVHQIIGSGDAVQSFHLRWPWKAADC